MNQLRKIFARVLDLDESEITDQTSRENTENWDSFNHLLLVNEIERECKVRFTINEVEKVKNIRDAKNLLIQKGIKGDGL